MDNSKSILNENYFDTLCIIDPTGHQQKDIKSIKEDRHQRYKRLAFTRSIT